MFFLEKKWDYYEGQNYIILITRKEIILSSHLLDKARHYHL